MSLRHLLHGEGGLLVRRAMLPFKAYIVGTLLVLLVGSVVVSDGPLGESDEGRDIAKLVVYGYLASSFALILLGLAAALQKPDRKTLWGAVAYAGVALLLAAMLWPWAFPPPTRV